MSILSQEENLNFTKFKNFSYNKQISEFILIDSFLVDILKYLSLQDLAMIRQVSKIFQKLIDNEKTIIFEKINISIFEDKINLNWLLNIIRNNQIKKMNLLLCDNIYYVRQILFSINSDYLEELKIPTKFFMGKNELTRFKRLNKLTIKNMYFIEGGLDEDIHMITNLIELPWIKFLKLNNIKFVKAGFMQYLNNKFEKLDFRESADFRIEDMREFIFSQSDSLKIIRLDGEMSNENALSESIIRLNNLSELYIGYCENFTPNLLLQISKNLQNLNKLTLRKLRVDTNSLENFFTNLKMENMQKIDFYDCPYFNNLCALQISDNCPKLEYLEISWSNGVLDQSIINLFDKSPNLQFLYVQGCKLLSDKVFAKVLDSDTHKDIFNSLKLIDFSKCDLLHDSLLYKVMEKYPCLAIINYYGMNLKYEI
jgi:hypothetical protein